MTWKRIFLILIVVTSTIRWVASQSSFLVRIEDRAEFSHVSQLRSIGSMKLRNVIQSPMNIILVEGDNTLTEKDVITELSPLYKILTIQKNHKLKHRSEPNDSLYSRQWQYSNNGVNSNGGLPGADISAQRAWDITTGGKTMSGKEIVVAVIDDGISQAHPDLRANLWKNKNEIPLNKIDDDGNGYIDDVNGWNVINSNDNVDSDASHGTPVAGIVGAKGNNTIGVTGVNWDVKIMPVYYGTATEANALSSYAYVYQQRKLYNMTQGAKGAFVVATNTSWGVDGGLAEDAPLWCAMYDSLGSVGILNAAATANQNSNVEIDGDLPTTCTSDYLIAVTNINKLNQKANAAFGKKSIDLAAYGDGVFSITKSGYSTFNGTSAAAPHVAGAIGLMYAVNCGYIDSLTNISPARTALVIRDMILNNVTHNAIYESLTTTEGVLNLGNAVHAILAQCGSCVAMAGVKGSIVDKRNLKIEWLPASGQKQLRYRRSDTNTEWIVSGVFNHDSILVSGLEYCTEYVYQVRQYCGNDTTAWSQHYYIPTTGCCAPPTQTKYSLTNNNITIEGVNGNQYLIYYSSSLGLVDSQFFTSKTSLTKLIDCAEYSIRIAEFCPVQERYSNLSVPVKQSSFCGECSRSYCIAGSYDNDSEWIDEVTINGVTNTSGKTSNGFGEHIGSFVPKVKRGDSIAINIKPGYKGSSFREHYGVYVDWDGNGEFSNDENVFNTKDALNGLVSLKFAVPLLTKYGLTRMRIIMSYTGNQAGCQGNSEFGETEDYCINVVNESNATTIDEQPIVSYWPNPTNGSLNIRSTKVLDHFTIYDHLGRKVFALQEGINIGEIKLELNLSTGLYLLVSEYGDGKRVMEKLVIE